MKQWIIECKLDNNQWLPADVATSRDMARLQQRLMKIKAQMNGSKSHSRIRAYRRDENSRG